MKKLIRKTAAVISLAMLPIMGVYAGAGNHHAALFVGGTYASSNTDPTVALEYEYRTPLWDRRIGIGLVAERIFGDKYDANLFLGGVVVHPWKDLKFNFSAGTKFVQSKEKSVLRAGVGYDLHYNNISYGPLYNLDVVSGKVAHVFGVTVGLGF